MGGGKGGGGSSTTTVQKADPWSGQQPYLQEIFKEAQKLYQNGGLAPDYYPGQTVADQSQWTQDALQMQADRAQNGSALIDNASDAMNNITTGGALANNQGLNTLNQLSQEDNPYVDELYNRANQQAQSAINGNFSAAGRYGSGAHAAASADAANNLASQMYSSLWDKRADAAASAGQLYNTGIGQQVVAGQTGQSLANQAYTDAAALGQAGAAMDDYTQQKINADIDRSTTNSSRRCSPCRITTTSFRAITAAPPPRPASRAAGAHSAMLWAVHLPEAAWLPCWEPAIPSSAGQLLRAASSGCSRG